jgi:hypothetical protein
MTDRMIILLNENWSLGYDKHQWMIRKLKKRGDETYWHAVSFIGTEKWILERNLREEGVEVSTEAQAYLDAMPDNFKQWYKTSDAEMQRLSDLSKEAAE